MPHALDPRAHAAVLLLAGEQVAQAPFRLVEDVGDAVRVLGDRELAVAEVPRTHQVDGAEVVDDVEVHRTAVVVRRVVPAAHKEQPLAMLPVRAALDDVEPAGLLRQLPLLGRERAAHDLRVARAGRPVRVRLLLRDAAALLVESAHVDAKRLLGRARRDAERGAAPHVGDAHEIAPLVRHAREIHLVRLLARERHALLGHAVPHAHARRLMRIEHDVALPRVHQLPADHRPLRLPRAVRRTEPRAGIRELRHLRQVAHLVHLEERAGLGGVVLGERFVPHGEDRVDHARHGLLRARVVEPLRHGPVARLAGQALPLLRIVRLVRARVGIEEPHLRDRRRRLELRMPQTQKHHGGRANDRHGHKADTDFPTGFHADNYTKPSALPQATRVAKSQSGAAPCRPRCRR